MPCYDTEMTQERGGLAWGVRMCYIMGPVVAHQALSPTGHGTSERCARGSHLLLQMDKGLHVVTVQALLVFAPRMRHKPRSYPDAARRGTQAGALTFTAHMRRLRGPSHTSTPPRWTCATRTRRRGRASAFVYWNVTAGAARIVPAPRT